MNRFYKILKILCSLIFVFSFVHKTCFAAQVVTPMDIYSGEAVQYDNQYLTLYARQYDLQGEFCARLLAIKNDPSALPFVQRFAYIISNLGYQNKFIYLVKSPDNDTFYAWYTGFKDSYTTSINQYVKIGDYVYNYCPVVTGPIYNFAYWNSQNGLISNETTASTMTIPYAMTNVFNPQIIEVFRAFGIYESTFESDVRELLEDISTASQTNYTTALNTINENILDQTETLHSDLSDVTNTIEDTNEKLDAVENTLEDTNEFLQSTDVDDDAFDLPTEDTQDITEDGINNIFTVIQNAFTSTPTNFRFPIPFTDKSIFVSAWYTKDMLTLNGGSWVVTFVEAFYWYLISRFIILDIAKKIKKIKSGNLENIQNDNIKEDML